MKKILLFLFIAGTAGSVFAQNFVAPQRRVPPGATPNSLRIVHEGGLQRAARTGNVLQAVNLGAPSEFGTGAQFVEYRESDPFQRPRGTTHDQPIALRLFAFEF